jgi:hypothetical protein
VPAHQSAALVGLEWLCLFSGVASGGRGSLPHVFVTVLEGGRTRQHLLRLGLLGGSFLLRWLRTGHALRRTGIELPLVLLLAGQALPHVLMRDGRRFLPKAVRTMATLGMYYALLERGRHAQARVAAGVAVNAALLAVQWPTTWNFSDSPAYYGSLQRIGLAINRRIGPLPGPHVTKNRVAGALAAALPMALALARRRAAGHRRGSVARRAFFGGLALLSAGGLVLSFGRTAWLAAAAASAIHALATVRARWRPAGSIRAPLWVFIPLPVVLATARLRRNGLPLAGMLERLSAANRSFDQRWNLARAGVALVQDYRYTGAGHESLTSIHAHYGSLHHVPRYSHSHNVYLNTWLEDGLLGALGLGWGILTALRWGWRAGGRSDLTPLAVGGFASLAAMGITGLAHDYWVHGVKNDYHTEDWRQTRTFLVPGVLLGVAGALARAGVPDEGPGMWPPWIPLLGGPLLAVWVVRRRWSLMAAWHANIGALLQARLELQRYDPARFDRPLLDEIRRDGALTPALARFRRALGWDPRNATALRRLGAVALSRGRYDEAGTLLRQAWAAGHRDRATVLLYGDVLVAEGREVEAVEILQGLELAASRLRFQAWYRYESRGDHVRATRATRAAALLEAAGHE